MKKTLFTILAAMGISIPSLARHTDSIAVLSPQQFMAQSQADRHAVIMDVRTPDEYAAGHLKGAVLLDYLNTEAFEKGIRKLSKRNTYYIYCRSGKRSHAASIRMQQCGLKVIDMLGGYLNWTQQGQEVVR